MMGGVIMEQGIYSKVRSWMYQNARHIEVCLWQYHFEGGDKEAVIKALMNYQNDDGGFGHALEADNWNPNSSPITTQHALSILRDIDFWDMSHPIYQGIWKYLISEKDLLEYGWRFTIPTNDENPRAPWWDYNEDCNKKEYFGVTAEFTAFILKFGDKETYLYKKALKLTDELIELLMSDAYYGDNGIGGYITLADTVDKLGLMQYDSGKIEHRLANKIKNSIEYDITKWSSYGVRPSNYINSPDSIFYNENSEIVNKELQYLIETIPENDVWGITWTWFGNMEKYGREFVLSENWWKGYKAIEKMLFLRNFGKI
jgi:hypothetical protein